MAVKNRKNIRSSREDLLSASMASTVFFSLSKEDDFEGFEISFETLSKESFRFFLDFSRFCRIIISLVYSAVIDSIVEFGVNWARSTPDDVIDKAQKGEKAPVRNSIGKVAGLILN